MVGKTDALALYALAERISIGLIPRVHIHNRAVRTMTYPRIAQRITSSQEGSFPYSIMPAAKIRPAAKRRM